MTHKSDAERYQTLSNTQELLRGVEDASDAFLLEDILAEYGDGSSKEVKKAEEKKPAEKAEVKRKKEEPAKPAAAETVRFAPVEKPQEKKTVKEAPAAPAAAPAAETVPEPFRKKKRAGMTIEDVVAQTVDQVQEEEAVEEEIIPQRKGFFFSRRKREETEQIYEPVDLSHQEPEIVEEYNEPEEDEEEPIEEIPLEEAYVAFHKLSRTRFSRVAPVVVLTVLEGILAILNYFRAPIPVWSESVLLQSLVLLVLHALVCAVGIGVFYDAVEALRSRRCTAAVIVALANIAVLLDCLLRPFLLGRGEAEPLCAVAAISMCFAVWARAARTRAATAGFRVACMGEPNYTVCSTADGACKSHGTMEGFYRNTVAEDPVSRWQTVLLPLVIAASFVFAGLASLGQGKGGNIFWCWSVILVMATTFALPLVYALPYYRFANRLQKNGSAISGYRGAKLLSRNRRMVVNDMDMFPPGTLQLNGIKVFGEEISKVVSYAASLAKASGSGLERIFDALLQSEGGAYLQLDNFEFCGEGGVSAAIHGETAVLGSASCMRKMGVRLPSGLTLKTGVFLAVDGQLTAIFAAKYLPAENVGWALRAMHRNRVVPVLATRDGNITPALLKRKFSLDAGAVYPPLSERVALSDVTEGHDDDTAAVLFREGLMPYAEVVIGSGRFCKAVRTGNIITLVGSVAGALLGFYFSFAGALHVLNPVSLAIYLALWSLPTFLAAGWVNHY